MTLDDLLVMSRTVWGEARGEGERGMLAVAWVIRNRADWPRPTWWGNTVAECCLAQFQFSCWLSSDPNRDKLLAIGLDDKQFRTAMRVCLEALDGVKPDPTGGASHYFAKSIPTPAWAKGQKPTAEIGNHRFFKIGPG